MEQEMENILDSKNIIVMKLLHYFITLKNYNPIILQGVENEIWLENLDEDYKIIRIVSNYIHNDEQFKFDIFKTKRIMKKVKKKTLSFNVNTLSIFLDLSDNVNLEKIKNIDCIKVDTEQDIKKSKLLNTVYPDLKQNLKFKEEGMDLFVKITNDINIHNKDDATKVEDVFKVKYPLITYLLIAINVIIFIIPTIFNKYDYFINQFALFAPYVKLGDYYRLITTAFLHADILHLLFNCYALYVIGSQLESFIGKKKFLIVYLFSALSGSLLSMIIYPNTVSIGASGAIFGLIGSLVYFGYHYRVYLGNVIKTQIIPLIVVNLFLGFMIQGIDNAAHIGGLIGGVLITMALGIKYKSTSFEKVNGLITSLIYIAFLIYMAFVYTT